MRHLHGVRAVAALVIGCLVAGLTPSVVLADAPQVNIQGPRYVPAGSVSPRLFVGTSFDNDDPYSRTLACGAQPPVASGAWYISGQEWFNCSFNAQGTYSVGVHAQNDPAEKTAAFLEVVATSRVRSVADGNVVITGHTPDRPFGGSLAFVDLNGDGKADFATGVAWPRAQPQEAGVRSVRVLFGRTTGGAVDDGDYTGTTGFLLSGTTDEIDFGTSIADAGDVNGDGYRDIIINSPAEENQPVARAYVVFGRSNIGSLTPATMTAAQGFRISATGLRRALLVARGADINGDGYSDVVVGTPDADLGKTGAPGAAFVVYGKAHPTDVDLASNPNTYGAELDGATYSANVGQSLALGDVNGDHRADVILGTSDYPGKVRIVFGKATLSGKIEVESMQPSVGFTVTGTGGFGAGAVGAGDLNGDGIAELLVASHRQLSGYDNRSRLSVILGRSSWTSFSLGTPPPGVFEYLMPKGESVANIATTDWNRDGKADVLIGAPSADIEGRGSAYIVPGQATLTNMQLDVLGSWERIDGDQIDANAGAALAAGDFNGDGRLDIGVGSPWIGSDDPDPVIAGRAAIFFGIKGPKRDTSPPVAFAPIPTLPGATFLTATPTIRMTWPAASDNVRVTRYRLQRKINSGVWSDVPLDSPATLTADVALTAGSNNYSFRVRAFDNAGNHSKWKTGPTFQVSLLQETNAAIAYAGTFATETQSGASGGSVNWSRTAGSTATVTFTGRAIELVTSRGIRGKLSFTLDGELLMPEFDLYEVTLPNPPWAGWIPVAYNLPQGTHTLVVTALGTSNGGSGEARIDIDAFLILK